METRYLLQRFFQEQHPADIRAGRQRMDLFPRKEEPSIQREDIVRAVLALQPAEYIQLTAPADILPEDTPNFRKKGSFLNIPSQRTRRELLEDRITLQRKAKEKFSAIDDKAHPGAFYWGIRARHRKLWSIATIMDGLLAYGLLAQNKIIGQEIPEAIAVADYGEQITYTVESFSELGVVYRGALKHLAIRSETKYADVVEITGKCSCEDDLWSTLANPRVADDYRFCKHQVTALLLGADLKDTTSKILLNPLPFVPKPSLIAHAESMERILTKEGKQLSGIRKEVLLWDIIRMENGRNLLYDPSFASARKVAGYMAERAYSSSPE